MSPSTILGRAAAAVGVFALSLVLGGCVKSVLVQGDPMSVENRNPKGFAKVEAFAPTYRAWLAEWSVKPEERVVDTQSGRTHLLVWGPADAPPLVVLHGASGSALDWVLQAEALAKNNRVYALDLPGQYGLTVSAKPVKKTADLVSWLDEILDALQLARVDLLGISLGGQTAFSYALHAPDRLNRLVVLAPASLLPLRTAYILRAMPMMFGTRGVYESFLRYLGPKENANHEPYETRVQRAADMITTARRHLGTPQVPFPSTLRDEELRALMLPTLLILGENEVIYDPRKAMSRAAALLPNVKTALIPGAGHDVMWSQPERLNSAITTFLSSQ